MQILFENTFQFILLFQMCVNNIFYYQFFFFFFFYFIVKLYFDNDFNLFLTRKEKLEAKITIIQSTVESSCRGTKSCQ